MLTQKELLKYPNYLLEDYQLEIYKQLIEYKKKNKLTQKQLAKKLKRRDAYVSKILNGDFDGSIKELIEISLMIGRVPYIEFVSQKEYWRRVNKAK